MNDAANINNDHGKPQQLDGLLKALNSMANVLAAITPGNVAIKLKEALQIIGTAAEADRMCVWEAAERDDRYYFCKKCEVALDPAFSHDEAVFQNVLNSKITPGVSAFGALTKDLPAA